MRITRNAERPHMADDHEILTLTAEIVASYVGNATHVQASEIPSLIKSIRAAFSKIDTPVDAEAARPALKATPAQIRKSITPDGLISFVDNRPYKTLKRHLSTNGMSHDEYKTRYGLPHDYPSVSSNYSAARSELAKQFGLGARGREAAASAPAKSVPKDARKPKATTPPESIAATE